MRHQVIAAFAAGTLTFGALAQESGGAADILLHVDGDLKGALAAVQSDLQKRPEDVLLMQKHATILIRLGRAAEAKAVLEQAVMLSPNNVNLRVLLSKVQGGAKQDPKPSDAMRRLIHQLDHGGMRDSTVVELDALGALAVPAILSEMTDLEPEGQGAAFQLLAQHDDPAVVATFEKWLADRDPIRRSIAGQAVSKITAEATRQRLAESMLSSKQWATVLNGVASLRGIAGRESQIRGALLKVVANGTHAQQASALERLSDMELASDAATLAILERATRSTSDDVRQNSLVVWLRLIGPERGVIQLRKAGRIDQAMRYDLMAAWRTDRSLGCLELWAELFELGSNYSAEAFRAMPRDVVRQAGKRLVPLLSAQQGAPIDSDLLSAIADLRMVELADDIAELLHHPQGNVRSDAFRTLERIAPEQIITRATELSQAGRGIDVAVVLAKHGAPEHVPAMIAAIEGGWARVTSNSSFQPVENLMAAIVGHCTAERLDQVLDLVATPAPGVPSGEWRDRCETVNRCIAKVFGAEHVAMACARLGKVDSGVADELCGAIRAHRSPAADAAVLATVEALLPLVREVYEGLETNQQVQPASATTLVRWLLPAVSRIGGDAAQAILQQALRMRPLSKAAFGEILSSSAADHVAVIGSILQSSELAHLHTQALANRPAGALLEESLGVARAYSGAGDSLGSFVSGLQADARRDLAKHWLERAHGGDAGAPEVLALRTLGDFRDEALIQVISKSLQSGSSGVREAAVNQLQRTFSKQAVEPLIEALKDDDPKVVSAATNALDRLAGFFEDQEAWRKKFDLGKRDGR